MYHCFRLKRGQDLYTEIKKYAEGHHIKAAAVLSGVGCVYRWELRDATGKRVQSKEEHAEILSLMGTVSENGCHLHICLGRDDLSAFGGHLRPGCLVNTTAEIVLAELEGYSFTRELDQETGYDELVISQMFHSTSQNSPYTMP